MGLWMSKAQLTVAPPVTLTQVDGMAGHIVEAYPLNPADLIDPNSVRLFDLVAMRPSNLVENAEVEVDQWWHGQVSGRDVFLPVGMRYRVADVQPSPRKRGG
jgi:hypothetical protein